MTSTTQSSFRHVTDEAEHRLIAPRITYNAPDVTRPERDRDNDTVGTLFANGAPSANIMCRSVIVKNGGLVPATEVARIAVGHLVGGQLQQQEAEAIATDESEVEDRE